MHITKIYCCQNKLLLALFHPVYAAVKKKLNGHHLKFGGPIFKKKIKKLKKKKKCTTRLLDAPTF